MSELWRRLRALFGRKQFHNDLAEEMQTHLEMQAEENEASGMGPDEARYAARRQFGNATLLKETSRDVWGWASLERLGQDLRYALRTLRRRPGFTATAVLSLALGIGANTAIFSTLNALILRPLPVANPQELVEFTNSLPLWETSADNRNRWFSYPQFERFRAVSTTLSGMSGGTRVGRVNVGFCNTPGVAFAEAYTGGFFSMLGVTARYGRFFSADDERAGAYVAVISDRYWRTRFGADPSIIGGPITINRAPFTVIGIAPPEFSGIAAGSRPDLWLPLHSLDRLKPDRNRWTEYFASWMIIVGRRRPGVSSSQAEAELNAIYRASLAEHARDLPNLENVRRFIRENRLMLQPAASGTSGGLRDDYAFPLTLLMSVAAVVLLAACVNVANLQLVRASARRREIALRLALGAGRSRIVRQFLTESMVLALLGGVLGFMLAEWGSRALIRMLPEPLDVQPDWRVFGFTAAVSLLTGVVFGLASALRGTRVDPGVAIKEGKGNVSPSGRLPDGVLVVVQVALSVVLVTGAGLFVRTLQKLRGVDPGYERENVLMFSVDARLAGYPENRAGRLYRSIFQELEKLPGVQRASVSVVRPVDDSFYLADQIGEVDGVSLPPREAIRVAWNSIGPGYFFTIGTPMLLGRDFDLRDDEGAPRVLIVNESLATRAFPGRNPIGHRLGAATIVGVVKDSLYNGPRDQPRPVLYYSLFQHGSDQEFRWGFASFALRYHSDANLVEQVRRAVASVDGSLPIFRVNTLRTQTEESLLPERLLATLSVFFAALVLLLACVGLYGVTAYTVTRRTAEIGIRMALGAARSHVISLVLGRTLRLTLAGLGAGIVIALCASRFTRSLLFGIGPADPSVIAITIAALTCVAALSCYLPARRATNIDPMEALRHE